METQVRKLLFHRFILVLILCGCIAFRPTALSLLNAIFIFVLPCVPLRRSESTREGIYFKLFVLVSSLALICQIVVQVTWIYHPPEDSLLSFCYTIGFAYFKDHSALKILTWMLPEIISFLSSLLFYFLQRKPAKASNSNLKEVVIVAADKDSKIKPKAQWSLENIGTYTSTISLCIAGVMQPSILNSSYFVCFLVTATWLACNKSLNRKFASLLRFVSLILCCHVAIIILYQTPAVQSWVPDKSSAYRVSGLSKIFLPVSESSDSVFNSKLNSYEYISPFVLIVTHFILTITSRAIDHSKTKEASPAEVQKRFPMAVKKVMAALHNNPPNPQTPLTRKKRQSLIASMNRNLTNLYFASAYIITNASMMIWSIVYHSWLGFALLIWANIIWARKNQRSFMMKSSPALVIYSSGLLVFNYIYCMNFDDSELPVLFENVDLGELGLVRFKAFPGLHLLFKSFLMITFWITMRQMFQEQIISRHRRTLLFEENLWKLIQKAENSEGGGLFSTVISAVKEFCVFGLMWIIVLLLFVMSVTGEANLFKIANMSFVLTFLIIFQFSFTRWLKLMHFYWMTLITYAMSALVLIYVYQFKSFPVFPLHDEIGLNVFETGELFRKLLPFTLVILLTGLQLNHFQTQFVDRIDKAEEEQAKRKTIDEQISIVQSSDRGVFMNFLSKFIIYLEIHLLKIIFISMFCLMCLQIQLFNIVLMVLLALGASTKSDALKTIIIRTTSLFCGLFIVGRMLWELKKVHVNLSFRRMLNTDIVCLQEVPEMDFSIGFILKNAEQWFAFNKSEGVFLAILPYFLFLVAITFLRAIKITSSLKRSANKNPEVVFDDVAGADADESFTSLLKYLVNHGFYNFGKEIVLAMFIVVIFTRLNVVAIFYIVWMIVLLPHRFENSEKLWKVATLSVMVSLVLQCVVLLMFVFIEPCRSRRRVDSESSMMGIVKFFYENFQSAYKHPMTLICDFILLVLLNCKVQSFDQNSETQRAFGGNENASQKYSIQGKIRTMMDFLKFFIFKILIWVSVTVIFLAGTYRVDVFSIGYISATFMLIWFGTEFYMKSLSGIIGWWDKLLAFNVGVIVFKILVKIFGCNQGNHIPVSFCWLAEVFDVPCADPSVKSDFCDDLTTEPPYLCDGIAFIMILLQKRVFLNKYFMNVINDAIATSILSSRGAELIEELRTDEVKQLRLEEEWSLNNLKVKMESIINSAFLMNRNRKEPMSHDHAIHSGGYFMFRDELKQKLLPRTILRQKSSLSIQTKQSVWSPPSPEVQSESSEEEISKKAPAESKMNFKLKVALFFKSSLTKLVVGMHNTSKNYQIIIKILEDEKKLLKQTLKESAGKTVHEIRVFIKNKRRTKQTKVFDHPSRSSFDADQASLTGFFVELFYFALTFTDVLVYAAVCLVQVNTSSILTLPLTLMVFLWGTLTFPRPPNAFWNLLIAYTQTIVIVKYFSQFDLVWWNKSHRFTELIGNQERTNLAMDELFLLMTLIIHRAILKKFGLWKSTENFKFQSGNFYIEKCDPKTQELIHKSFLVHEATNEPTEEEDTTDSSATLINRETAKKVVSKHKLDSDSNKIEAVLVNPEDFIRAREEISRNQSGEVSIKLRQDETKLRLRAIDRKDFSKKYQLGSLAVVETVIEEPASMFASAMLVSFKKHFFMFGNCLELMQAKRTTLRKNVDVYTYLFFCELMNFLILLFGFREFWSHPSRDDNSIFTIIEENKIPTQLLVLLVIQFAMIIIDRMLYLRKNMTGKVLFHLLTVFYIPFWMFFLLPLSSGQSLNRTTLPVIYYLIKCVYILLSAYQIRYGYPSKTLGNWLMKNYGFLELNLFKIYMAIPFLFELRTVLDWALTETTLVFGEWMKVESIYAQVYKIKCHREIKEKDTTRGQKQRHVSKLLVGGGITLFLLGVLWFPLVLFAFSSALGNSNVPYEFSFSLQIGSYEPLFQVDATSSNIQIFDNQDRNKIKSLYSRYPEATAFLEDYEASDIVAISLSTNETTLWMVSPANAAKMINDIRKGIAKKITLTCRIIRKNAPETIFKKFEANIFGQAMRDKLVDMLENPDDTKSLMIPMIFPKLVNIRNKGTVELMSELIPMASEQKLQNITIRMHASIVDGESWWELNEICNSQLYNQLFKHFPYQNCKDYLTMYLFNEKSFSGQSQLSQFIVKGIVGLYLTLLIAFPRLLRSTIFNVQTLPIIVEELPNVDRIINLCNEIYLVREAREFTLEEDLVAKLIFLYRSPETLIRFSKFGNE